MVAFVDTNVLVYARDPYAGIKREIASDWMSKLWAEDAGRISFQVLGEFYVTVTRKLRETVDEGVAWAEVSDLLAWKPRAIDAELLKRAHEITLRYKLSWWDSQIVAAAQLQNCTLLLTEDLQDGADLGGVTVLNPFGNRVNEAVADYAAPIPIRGSTHPRRGRPPGSKRSATPGT